MSYRRKLIVFASWLHACRSAAKASLVVVGISALGLAQWGCGQNPPARPVHLMMTDSSQRYSIPANYFAAQYQPRRIVDGFEVVPDFLLEGDAAEFSPRHTNETSGDFFFRNHRLIVTVLAQSTHSWIYDLVNYRRSQILGGATIIARNGDQNEQSLSVKTAAPFAPSSMLNVYDSASPHSFEYCFAAKSIHGFGRCQDNVAAGALTLQIGYPSDLEPYRKLIQQHVLEKLKSWQIRK
jgi:hypothetical protein